MAALAVISAHGSWHNCRCRLAAGMCGTSDAPPVGGTMALELCVFRGSLLSSVASQPGECFELGAGRGYADLILGLHQRSLQDGSLAQLRSCPYLTVLRFSNVEVTLLLSWFSPGAPPVVLLNYASVSLDTRIPRDTVQRCVQETLLFLSYTLAKKQDVDFTFKDIGCLRFRKNKVKMRFSADFLCTLDSTGRLLKSLRSVSVSLGQHCHGLLGNALKGPWQ